MVTIVFQNDFQSEIYLNNIFLNSFLILK